jgi:short-subunit dehydrogenase
MKINQARVVLTGATGGIGRAIAKQLLLQGAAVLLVARSPARLAALNRELARELKTADEAKAKISWHACDLTQPEAAQSLRAAAEEWHANVLINNAGVASFGRIDSFSAEHMAQVLDTNLLAPMRLTQALLPLLRTRPKAQVVQIGSALGRLALPGFSVYCASKFGLRGFSEALRRELGDTSVKVQYLGPRSTRTAFNDEQVMRFNRGTGTAMDSPETVAQALVQLIESEKAERFVGFPETLAVRLNGLAPSRMDGAFAKHRQHLPADKRASSIAPSQAATSLARP